MRGRGEGVVRWGCGLGDCVVVVELCVRGKGG